VRPTSDLINTLQGLVEETFKGLKMAAQKFIFPIDYRSSAGHKGMDPILFTETVDNLGRLQER
jgi:hypothetical protein